MRQDTDLFVTLLPVATTAHHSHNNVFRGHERQLRSNVAGNNSRVNNKTLTDILQQRQNHISRQERLRDRQAAVGTVVERAFHPLATGRLTSAVEYVTEPASQTAHTLRAHRVTFVRHSTRANLVLFKRLFHLFQVAQETDVRGDLERRRSKGRQRRKHVDIDLARVGLARHRHGIGEFEQLCYALVQSLDLVVVTIKKLQEAGLRTCGALDATEAKVVACTAQVTQIPQQVLDPQRRTFTHGRKLRRLHVRESKRG